MDGCLLRTSLFICLNTPNVAIAGFVLNLMTSGPLTQITAAGYTTGYFGVWVSVYGILFPHRLRPGIKASDSALSHIFVYGCVLMLSLFVSWICQHP